MNHKEYISLLKLNIKDAFKENSRLLLLSVILFFIPLIISTLYPSIVAPIGQYFINELKKQIIAGTVTLSYDSIFINNSTVGLRFYIFGIFFGVLDALMLIINSVIIGYLLGTQSFFVVLLYIIPHGIFEIPAMLIAATSGFILFKFLYNFIKNIYRPDWDFINNKYNRTMGFSFNESDSLSFKSKIKISFSKTNPIFIQSLIFLIISVILFMIAAYIEVYLTGDIAQYFINVFHIH